jgi:phosphate starvation-inducible PhoH-like protein
MDSHEEALQLFGPGDRNLKLLRDAFQVQLVGRGSTLKLAGETPAVEEVEGILKAMLILYRKSGRVPPDHLERELQTREARASDARGDSGYEPDDGPKGGLRAEEMALVRSTARSRGQEGYLRAILHHELVFCTGPAGTGKTFLAVCMAVNLLKRDVVRKIILCRPAVEAGEKLGFLPGDFQAKINPYLRPLYDALNDTLEYDQVKRYLEREIIEILPLAYMRGRTLNNAFIILDEGQNTTVSQMKMFLTRMGMNSRIVVNGDVTQADLPEDTLSGLVHAVRVVDGIPGIAWVRLEKSDIVRHPLVKRIVEAYEAVEGGHRNAP